MRIRALVALLLLPTACSVGGPERTAPTPQPAPSVSGSPGECAITTKIGFVRGAERPGGGYAGAALLPGAELAVEIVGSRGSSSYRTIVSDEGSGAEVLVNLIAEGVAVIVGDVPPVAARVAQASEVPLLSTGDDPTITEVGDYVFRLTATEEELLRDRRRAVAWHSLSPAGTNADFVERFERARGREPDTGDAYGYAAVLLIARAVEAACSEDPEAVRSELADTQGTNTPFGPFTFTEERAPSHAVVILDGHGRPAKLAPLRSMR